MTMPLILLFSLLLLLVETTPVAEVDQVETVDVQKTSVDASRLVEAEERARRGEDPGDGATLVVRMYRYFVTCVKRTLFSLNDKGEIEVSQSSVVTRALHAVTKFLWIPFTHHAAKPKHVAVDPRADSATDGTGLSSSPVDYSIDSEEDYTPNHADNALLSALHFAVPFVSGMTMTAGNTQLRWWHVLLIVLTSLSTLAALATLCSHCRRRRPALYTALPTYADVCAEKEKPLLYGI